MARTTGYTATASINLILDNLFNSRGVFPPEIVGANINCMESILEYLRQRNVIISEKTH